MRQRTFAFIVAAGMLLSAAPASAHHAFSAEFDAKKPIKLVGTVTEWELVNPHSWIHMDVKNADGTVTNWMIEVGSPNSLFRLGFNKNSLPAGTEITVDRYRSKDGWNSAVGKNHTFVDGKSLFLGGSAGEPPAPEKK